MAALLTRNLDSHAKQCLIKAPVFECRTLLFGFSRELTNHHAPTNVLTHRCFIMSTSRFNIFKRLFSLSWQSDKNIRRQKDSLVDKTGSSYLDSLNFFKFRYNPPLDVQPDKETSFPFFDHSQAATVSNISANNEAQKKKISIEAFRQDMLQTNEQFLISFPNALDKMVKSVSISAPVRIKARKKPVPKPRMAAPQKKIYFPLWNKAHQVATKTCFYETMFTFLTSLNIPCEQLGYYPDIQLMSHNDVLDCLIKLNESGIHRIFSLFLISRMNMELKYNNCTNSDETVITLGRRKIMRFKSVRAYLELCNIFEIPDLDINDLLIKLAAVGVYDDIYVILTKTKKLISIGASPKDLLNNLELYQGYEFFDEKIQIYKSTELHTIMKSFPLDLFLSKKIRIFKEKLAIDYAVKEIAELLDVSIPNLQACWQLWEFNLVKLKYKIKMCIKSGIPKQDIFNNLKMLDKITVEKCHSATVCFQASGLPVSLYLLKAMEKTLEMNGVTGETLQAVDKHSEREDWISCSTQAVSPQDNTAEEPKKNIFSRHKPQRQIINLLSNKLHLDRGTLVSLFKDRIDTTQIDIQDITRNLNYLSCKGFTLQHMATCPQVLLYPSHKLRASSDSLREAVLGQLSSASCILPSHMAEISEHQDGDENSAVVHIVEVLLSCPIKHLNTLLYILEKEKSFNLSVHS